MTGTAEAGKTKMGEIVSGLGSASAADTVVGSPDLLITIGVTLLLF